MNIFKQYKGLRREIYVLFFGRIVTALGSMAYPILTLILSSKFGMSAASIANLFIFTSLIQLPLMYLSGYLSDRVNKKKIIIVCDLVTVFCYFVVSIIELSKVSIVLIVIASVFASIEHPAYDALVADLSSYEDREKAFSLGYLGMNLGMVLSPSIGGFLFANNQLSLIFLFSSLATLLSTLLIIFLVKDISVAKSTSGKDVYETQEEGSMLKVLLNRKVLIFFIICGGFIQVFYSQFNFLLPLNMEQLYGDQGALIFGTITSVNAAVVILFTPIVTSRTQKIRDIQKIVLGVSLLVLGFGMYIFIQGMMPLYYVSIIIFTFGEIFETLGMQPYLTRRVPATHRGRITGLYRILVIIIVALCQKVVGLMIDQYAMTTVWKVMTGFGLLTIIMLFVLGTFDKKTFKELYNDN